MNKQRINISSKEFQAKGEYILVRPFETLKEETTAGGIVLQIEETVLSRPTFGEVVSLGKEIKDITLGQAVLWPETDGIDLEFNDGYFVLIRERSVLGTQV